MRKLRRLGFRRRQAEHLRHLPRPRPRAHAERHLLDPAGLSAMRRQRQEDRQSMPSLPRRRPRAAGQDAGGEDSGRRRQRRPHPPGRRRRSRSRRSARGRSVRRSRRCASTRSSSASATTCIAKCRSASRRPRSAPRSKCRRSAARPSIKIPPETQTGKLFRLRGKGVRNVRNGHVGDLICRVVVETPVKLNKQPARTARAVRSELRRRCAPCTRRARVRWLDGVKQFWERVTS